MRIPRRILLTAAVALAVSFCSRTPAPEPGQPAGETTLVVENQSTLQVTIYVRRDAQRQRLGDASALSTTRLRIPENLIFGPTALRFEVDPLGSRQTPISQEITVSAGEEIVLVVPSTLR